jgi:acetolactate synthase-1/2/3 large subunit
MGFGLPAAMGVQMVNPGATVACVTGEASIQMCIQELSTCKQYHLPIKIVNLNNRYMGMVRQWQQFFYGNRYAESYMDALPDFVKLAEAYGHVGYNRKAGRCRRRAQGCLRAKGAIGLPRFHHRPEGERLPDGARWQGIDRNDPVRGTVDMRLPFEGL